MDGPTDIVTYRAAITAKTGGRSNFKLLIFPFMVSNLFTMFG